MKMNRAMIYVNDFPRMAEFYRGVLGLKPIGVPIEDYIEFDARGTTFALHAIPVELRCEPSATVQPREKNPIKLSFEVDDVAAECARLAKFGVMILTRPWGAQDFVDPEGNIFGLCAPSVR